MKYNIKEMEEIHAFYCTNESTKENKDPMLKKIFGQGFNKYVCEEEGKGE